MMTCIKWPSVTNQKSDIISKQNLFLFNLGNLEQIFNVSVKQFDVPIFRIFIGISVAIDEQSHRL